MARNASGSADDQAAKAAPAAPTAPATGDGGSTYNIAGAVFHGPTAVGDHAIVIGNVVNHRGER